MEHPAFDGRAYAIAAGPRRLLEAAGLWDKLPEPTCPILDIRVTDGRVGRAASPLHLHFATRTWVRRPGPFGWMVEARSLRVALNAHMAALPALQVFAPAEARVERRADGAVVRVAGGPEIACRLVIAAEGRRSALRDEAGIPVTRLPYGQTGIVCAVAHERPHHNVALEHFLPSGPFAAADVCCDRCAVCVRLAWCGVRGLAGYWFGTRCFANVSAPTSRQSCGPSAIGWRGSCWGWTMLASPAKSPGGWAITWGRCGRSGGAGIIPWRR
jgi:2-polyprenyl-6-methoxyphenol hydroxylase-like FAD-dependent oxidoreductase